MRRRWRQWRHRERRLVDLNEVRFGVTRWTLIRLAFVLMGLGAIGSSWLVKLNFDEDERREDRENVQDAYDDCLRGNDTRAVIRDIIELTPTGRPLNLTGVPGFDALDPATQDYLRNLEAASRGNPDDPSFRDLAIELLPIRNCEREYPSATVVP